MLLTIWSKVALLIQETDGSGLPQLRPFFLQYSQIGGHVEQGSLFFYCSKDQRITPFLFVSDPLWQASSLALYCKGAALDPDTNLFEQLYTRPTLLISSENFTDL